MAFRGLLLFAVHFLPAVVIAAPAEEAPTQQHVFKLQVDDNPPRSAATRQHRNLYGRFLHITGAPTTPSPYAIFNA
jgi:hypothetical protein